MSWFLRLFAFVCTIKITFLNQLSSYINNFKTPTGLDCRTYSTQFSGDGQLFDYNPAFLTTGSNYPYCRITFKNGLEVATKNEIYYIGLGQTNNVDWVDTIQYNNRIDNISDWSDPNSNIWMWVVPPTGMWGSNGCWYNLINAEKYIGFRMKINSHYKLGWIKVNEISRENMSFISYAIEK